VRQDFRARERPKQQKKANQMMKMPVRCTHGATSGQIDKDELFYLRTRGIPTKVAQRLLVTGFLDEVIQRVNHPAIGDHLHRLIEEKFAA
jgi:Fe-S cluster assembly protein SufD